MRHIDLSAFEQTPLVIQPFDYLVVPRFLRSESLRQLIADFPDTGYSGLAPLSAVKCRGAFAELIEEITSAELESTFAAKYQMDLAPLPLMVTVRSRARARDGAIHTDTASKVITALVYLNEAWEAGGGRLRFLADPKDIEAVIAEVPPEGGTLASFRRSERSYHGHLPFSGPRRAIMFNWMSDELAVRRELARHSISARIKRLWRQ